MGAFGYPVPVNQPFVNRVALLDQAGGLGVALQEQPNEDWPKVVVNLCVVALGINERLLAHLLDKPGARDAPARRHAFQEQPLGKGHSLGVDARPGVEAAKPCCCPRFLLFGVPRLYGGGPASHCRPLSR